MALLNLFSRNGHTLMRLPTGSFTVDRAGTVTTCTVPSSFPSELVSDVARTILEVFRRANEANQPISELVVDFSSLRIKARELRGGALVFLIPREAEMNLSEN